MRIVAGRHRGRRLTAPAGAAVRPTSDRARQAVFNILMHNPALAGPGRPNAVVGAQVLDAFAGTGAMGLEALSRGAAGLAAIETDREAVAALRENLRRLGELERARLYRTDAADPPPRPPGQPAADLAFLDPPYGEGLAGPALAALSSRGWLAPGALCVVEIGPRDALAPPAGFTPLDERRYGRARIVFLRAPA
ncbi:MAG: 16S rRNA (guanine(966)-N(2))-methyltransferase RsmD [Rhodospirillaceae bacterium]|nr:16S rRNA (guanine(966)-N(2))-methyltransferase RsmD [Rhodospirillaceae bacterium]